MRRANLAAVVVLGALCAAVLADPSRAAPGVLAHGYGGFSSAAGDYPGGLWRPFAERSPWNRRLPASPRVLRNSRAMVREVLAYGDERVQSSPVGQGDYQHPVYYSSPGDPWYRLRCTMRWGRCESEGAVIQVPRGARPAQGGAGGDGDQHMTVVDQARRLSYDMWRAPRGGLPPGGTRSNPTTLPFAWGGHSRIDGSGDGGRRSRSTDGTPVGGSSATASLFPNLAGVVRVEELEAGRIDHALFMISKCQRRRSPTFVYPAGKGGARCGGRHAPRLGQRFHLDMTAAEIDALQVPRATRIIYHALREYGGYVGDTGGAGLTVAQLQSDESYTSFGRPGKIAEYEQANGDISAARFPGHRLRAITGP